GTGGQGAVGGQAGTGGQMGTGGTGTVSSFSCDAECGASSGAMVQVSAGADLQAAIDAAAPGDTLILTAGADYVGNFVLPVKAGSSCITIRTSTPDAQLPAATRVTPADAPKLARVISPGAGLPAIRTDTGAHHYRLIGLEVLPQSSSSAVYEVIAFGGAETALADVPHHLVVDRCYVHAWPGANFKRGIALNSGNSCVIASHVSDFHSDFQDSQAIGGFNGPGPFKIYNNRLEGGAENILFGGATPTIVGVIPSDIEVRGNHLYKPLSWKAGDPSNTGYTPWVKNLFELKNARNVVVDKNLMENNWDGADQHGIAIVLTPRSEGGTAPWTTVENVTITNNVIVHVGGGVQILGTDTPPSQQANHITVENNLFLDIRADYAFDPAVVRVIQFTGVDTLTFNHNTFIYADPTYPMFRTYGDPTTAFVYTNNLVFYGEGIWSDCGTNQTALTCKLPGSQMAGNVIIGGPSSEFPTGNFFPATAAAAGLNTSTPGSTRYSDYALSASSPYLTQGTDGNPPGIDAANLGP
ncbi:MAG TPA: hypothetical protein VGJ84_20495, partial [Polyangiaceae bacterium]